MKMKLLICLSLFSSVAFARTGPNADTTVQGTYFKDGQAVKGNFTLPAEYFTNVWFPARVLGEKFVSETGKAENIDFEKIDSVFIGGIQYKKSPWSNKSIMSMSEDDLSLARVAYEGTRVYAFYTYSYDKKEKTYGRKLIIKKANSEEFVNASNPKFVLLLKKQLAKLFEDCETVSKKAEEKAYGLGDQAVLAAVREYDSACK